jgi:acyl-CoA thioester hydrolase
MTRGAEEEKKEGRAHRTAVQMRFADTDAMGHVNNGSYVVYAETGRIDFMKTLGAVDRSFILAHLAIDFRRQVRFRESVVVESWVERIGTTSMTLRQAIRAEGTVAADVRSVVVSFDYMANRSTPWNTAVRAAMEPYRHEST